jgi:glycosyltransferase involved in cell wall biosynthesis
MNAGVVVPLFNEEANVEQLWQELRAVADRDARIASIVFVDDGSTDATFARLRAACAADSRARILRLRRNFGQTAALSAGFDALDTDIIVPMDGDLQNDPADIPRLLDKVEEGYDVVSGWRRKRRDAWLTRRVPSWFANRLISRITGVHLHDYGCMLKAYRRDVLQGINLYGQMHRFIPSLAAWMGVRIAELEVNHRPRVAGKSKYGLSRTLRVILDLINVKFLVSYASSPIQVFGKIGFGSLFLGFICAVLTVYMKWFAPPAHAYDITKNPFFLLTVLCVLIGVQFICLGLLGEIVIRTYYESQRKPIYAVRETFVGGQP